MFDPVVVPKHTLIWRASMIPWLAPMVPEMPGVARSGPGFDLPSEQ